MSNTAEVEAEAEVEDNVVDLEIDPKAEIRIAFDEGVTEEKEEDDVKLQMISAGATFKNVTRLYNEFMIEAGLAISKSDRNQIIDDNLEGRDLETEEDFAKAVEALGEAITGATLRSASALVRSYAKKNELPCWVKPKGDGSRPNFLSGFCDFIRANRDLNENEVTDYVKAIGSENTVKNAGHYLSIWKLAMDMKV